MDQPQQLNLTMGNGCATTMNNIETVRRHFVQVIRWLAPASCLLCRCQHNRARAICADCEAAFIARANDAHSLFRPRQDWGPAGQAAAPPHTVISVDTACDNRPISSAHTHPT